MYRIYTHIFMSPPYIKSKVCLFGPPSIQCETPRLNVNIEQTKLRASAINSKTGSIHDTRQFSSVNFD